jgi:hypothetical protein
MVGFDPRSGLHQRPLPLRRGHDDAVHTDQLGRRGLSGTDDDIGAYRAVGVSREGDSECF